MLLKSAPISICPGAAQIRDAAAVAQDRERPRIQLFDVLIVAGGNCGDSSMEIVDNWPFQILRLKSLTCPATGGGAMVAKRTANAVVITGTREQRIDLLDCCLSTAEAQLQCPLHLWR